MFEISKYANENSIVILDLKKQVALHSVNIKANSHDEFDYTNYHFKLYDSEEHSVKVLTLKDKIITIKKVF